MATANPEQQERFAGLIPVPGTGSAPGTDFRKPFLSHLEELRRRLIRSFLWVGLGTAAGWAWAPRILEALIRPVGQVVYLSPVEPFMTRLQVAVLAGIGAASPLLAWETWGFLRPALGGTRRAQAFALSAASAALFLAGLWAGWRFLLPAALKVLLSFGSASMAPMLTVGNYAGFAGWLLVSCGLAFQIPLAVWFVTRAGWVRPAALLRQWRVAVVVILVLAAALTPTPDVATQLLLASVLGALYALSVAVAFVGGKR